jgi:fimbrial chaperone protein
MLNSFKTLFLTASFISAPFLSFAASLQVSPTLIDLETEKSAASTITVRNTGTEPMNAQVRVFKWTQDGSKDVFTETTDVVASPPMTKLDPKGSYVIRVVRTKQTAPVGEESYRLIVDELPSENQKGGTIAMLVRHAIPVFFSNKNATPPVITWTLTRAKGKLSVKAVNNGDKRLRLANMAATSGSAKADFGKGLTGYVLGKSTMNFASKSQSGTFGGEISLKADTHLEPLDVKIKLQ